MGNILSGLVLVNGTDIWTEYGVFLVEERRGGMENLTAILTPSKAKRILPWIYGKSTGKNTVLCSPHGMKRGM